LAFVACFPLISLVIAQTSNNSYKQSPMAQLRSQFAAASSASQQNLLGRWVAVREIWTEEFLTGKTGADHVESDQNGLRRTANSQSVVGRPRSNVAGHPLEWTLTFHNRDSHLQATSEVPWQPSGDISNIKFSENGDFTFTKDYGGDAEWVYRCRAASLSELICVLDGGKGHGVVFRKMQDEQLPR
jgi:hypothetical protein